MGQSCLPFHHSVLVVDDDNDVRDVVVSACELMGLFVLQAANATDAMALLDLSPDVALLFTDVSMPSVSGLKLAAMARRRRPELKVILMSGQLVAPAVTYPLLKKPFRLQELQRIVSLELDGLFNGRLH